MKAYAGLYIISPLLNLWCERSSERTLRYTVIAFYAFQSWCGWIGVNLSVEGGYTTFSFIGLYLLARYMRLYFKGIKHSQWLLIYVVLSVAIGLLGIVATDWAYKYCSPLVVASAVALMMYFTGLKIKSSRVINYIAKSCFAVYLFQDGRVFNEIYHAQCHEAYQSHEGVMRLVAVSGVVLLFYAIGIMLDQPRRWIWRFVSKKLTL